MLKIKKIEEKMELLDVEAQADPCKFFWDNDGVAGLYDCLKDCKGKTPYASVKY
ncbi:hypothetical protein [Anaerosalibacter massiliensis]|uniref:Uncharacterized protein n=1 Tax=Anaerosalibacter massiliensis TaxID=1347392 RepID=A0A9X2MKY9_9FIRM|nr:hypothetical protein [Anaerosalibacter massiliensis]MCR2043146.1 hypothetical protein [Anaerosalibacter massiliensis]